MCVCVRATKQCSRTQMKHAKSGLNGLVLVGLFCGIIHQRAQQSIVFASTIQRIKLYRFWKMLSNLLFSSLFLVLFLFFFLLL